MPTAFVLLNTVIGSEADVLRELRKISSIEEALIVYGAYDIILRVESKSIAELKQTVTWKIRKMDYVTATQTMIMV
ncbi:MAG TPA: Lrp/AsnC ligand binding domain-containing protein [Candidatus Bathyarchaeia archaeon]|nr:Lrp/AsnC ligand binding domain-containing protein [Candidatus Bathyarchaeia archaeon]